MTNQLNGNQNETPLIHHSLYAGSVASLLAGVLKIKRLTVKDFLLAASVGSTMGVYFGMALANDFNHPYLILYVVFVGGFGLIYSVIGLHRTFKKIEKQFK